MGLVLGMLVAVLTGCGSVPIPPTYSQEELKRRCELQGGWWREGFLTDGFCEYPGRAELSSSATQTVRTTRDSESTG